jgi:site-specific DNA-adenine methylase
LEALRQFFPYYGSKWRAAKLYEQPRFGCVLEPFAGAAGYSLHFPDRKIILNDLDPVIANLWRYLVAVSESEILALPTKINHVDEHILPQEAKHLIGFWLNKGAATPNKSPSAWVRSGIRPNSSWGEAVKNRIASQLEYIRHWRVFNESYEKMLDQNGTWFIDPPYQNWGKRYRFKNLDFKKLSDWIMTRKGQVIVCEQEGAEWLPFMKLGKVKSSGIRDTHSSEMVFYDF